MVKITPNSSGARSRKKENNFIQESANVNFFEIKQDFEIPEKKINWRDILRKYRFVWGFAIFVALAAGFLGWFNLDRFSASLALTISRQGSQSSIDYKYDSYYALKATDEFGDTVVGWLKTPEVAQAVLKASGQESKGASLSSLSQKFKAAKISPSLVEVRFGVSREDEATKISEAIKQVISAKADLLNLSSDQGIAFVVVGGEAVVARNTFNLWLNILGGFLVGLIFGFFIKVAGEYFT